MDEFDKQTDPAHALEQQGQFEEAATQYREALRALAEEHGTDDHPDSLPIRTNLAACLARSGHHPEALKQIEEALEIAHRCNAGPYHVGSISFQMAQILKGTDPTRAFALAQKAYEALSTVLPPHHPHLQVAERTVAELAKADEPSDEHPIMDLLGPLLRNLRGVPDIDADTLRILTQRLVLAHNNIGGALLAASSEMGRPRLELEQATALTMPENMDPRQAEQLRQARASVEQMMHNVKEDVEAVLATRVDARGRIVVGETDEGKIPTEIRVAIGNEVVVMLDTAPQEMLLQELALIALGGRILIEEEGAPASLGFALDVVSRLPDHKEEAIAAMEPLIPPAVAPLWHVQLGLMEQEQEHEDGELLN
ncbi:MAG: tetratricopeptide repeat protein [Myxococcota bacterium]